MYSPADPKKNGSKSINYLIFLGIGVLIFGFGCKQEQAPISSKNKSNVTCYKDTYAVETEEGYVCRVKDEYIDNFVGAGWNELKSIVDNDEFKLISIRVALNKTFTGSSLNSLKMDSLKITHVWPNSIELLPTDDNEPLNLQICNRFSNLLKEEEQRESPSNVVVDHFAKLARGCLDNGYDVYGIDIRGKAGDILRWSQAHQEIIRRVEPYTDRFSPDANWSPPAPNEQLIKDLEPYKNL